MEPENDGFEKESPFPGADFQVPYETSGVYPTTRLKPPCQLSILHSPRH